MRARITRAERESRDIFTVPGAGYRHSAVDTVNVWVGGRRLKKGTLDTHRSPVTVTLHTYT